MQRDQHCCVWMFIVSLTLCASFPSNVGALEATTNTEIISPTHKVCNGGIAVK